MKNKLEPILSDIRESLSPIIKGGSFTQWLSKQKVTEGDLVVINNSFLKREGSSTRKNKKYLSIRVGKDLKLENEISVAYEVGQNNNFSLYRKDSPTFPKKIRTLSEEVDDEIKRLGKTVFILLGKIDDSIENEEAFARNHKIVLSPKSKAKLAYDATALTITINNTTDDDLWDLLVLENDIFNEDDKRRFHTALNSLQDSAVSNLIIPDKTPFPDGCFIDHITAVLDEYYDKYLENLNKWKKNKEDENAYNEMLRISYNFAEEAMTLYEFFTAIYDLKPLVMWGTVEQQYKLARCFEKLTLQKGMETKFSVKNYISTIKDARNRAFHNLMPFNKSLKAKLPISIFSGAEVLLFTTYKPSKSSDDKLNYDDKELLDTLMRFSRAKERKVSESFWSDNLAVIKNMEELARAMADFLRKLLVVC